MPVARSMRRVRRRRLVIYGQILGTAVLGVLAFICLAIGGGAIAHTVWRLIEYGWS